VCVLEDASRCEIHTTPTCETHRRAGEEWAPIQAELARDAPSGTVAGQPPSGTHFTSRTNLFLHTVGA
jgi:hypothetical protein